MQSNMNTDPGSDKNPETHTGYSNVLFSLYEHVSAAVFIMQGEDTFIFGNRAFCKMSGYTQEDLLQHKCNFIEPADTDTIRLSGKTLPVSVYNKKLSAILRCKDGSVSDIEIAYSKYNEGQSSYCIATITDISSFRNLSDELIFLDDKYHTLFENALNSIIITTMETGLIKEANVHAMGLFGYETREFRKLVCENIILRDDSYRAYISSLKLSGKYSGGLTGIRRNGEYFKVSISSWVYVNRQTKEKHVCNCFLDVSQKEKLEAFLDDTNKKGATGYFEFNFLNNQHVFSRVLKQLIEVPPDFVPDIERDIVFYKEGESRDTIVRLLSSCIETGIYGQEEVQLVTAKGREIWVKVSVNAERVDGKCVRVFGTLQDINDYMILYKKLFQKTAQLNKIFESVADIILIIDNEGKILETNEAVFTSWGYRPEELIGKTKINLVYAPDQKNTLDHNKEVKAGKTRYDFENRHLKKDGSVVHMSWSSRWDEKEEKFYLVGRDMTERMEKEKEVKFLSLVAAETINGAVLTDEKGNITWVNQAFEKITGYQLTELIGKRPGRILKGRDSDPVTTQYMRDSFYKGLPFSSELINYRKDGKGIWMHTQAHPIRDSRGNLEGWFALWTDISEKKAEEQKLKLFESVIENANDIIIISDAASSADGGPKIVYVNAAFEKATGYTKEEALGQSPRFLQGNETDHYTTASIHKHLDKWKPVQADVLNYKKNGEKFWNRLFITPVADHTGWFTNWIAIQRDVTEEKEQLLKMMNEEDQRKKELTKALLMGEDNHRRFMSMELHDNIAQLLLGMKLYLAQYQKKKKQEDLDEGMEILDRSIQEVRSLSHNLALREVDEKNISTALKGLLDKLVTVANIQVDFQADIRQEALTKELCTHIYRISQEQMNNIIKHSNASVVKYQIVQIDNRIILTITDNGDGFDSSVKADGIGFANIRSRTELFHGKFHLNSKPGQGCELSIELCIN